MDGSVTTTAIAKGSASKTKAKDLTTEAMAKGLACEARAKGLTSKRPSVRPYLDDETPKTESSGANEYNDEYNFMSYNCISNMTICGRTVGEDCPETPTCMQRNVRGKRPGAKRPRAWGESSRGETSRRRNVQAGGKRP